MKTEETEKALLVIYEFIENGQPMAATDTLVQLLDRWLTEGEIERVRLVLEKLDTSRCPPPVLTGVLSLTWHAKKDLEPTRGFFFERVMDALDLKWGLPKDLRSAIEERLR